MTEKFIVNTPWAHWVEYPTLEQATATAKYVVEKHGGLSEVFHRVATVSAKAEIEQ